MQTLYDDVRNVLNDAWARADDAVRRQLSDLFTSPPGTFNSQLAFGTFDSVLENNLEVQKNNIDRGLLSLRAQIESLAGVTNTALLDQALNDANLFLANMRDLLNMAMDAVDRAINLSPTLAATYRSNISAGRNTIFSAINNVDNLRQSIASQRRANESNLTTARARLNEAQNAVNIAQRQFGLRVAGATPAEISAQQAAIQAQTAQISQAQANVASNLAKIDNMELASPIDGIVTRQDAKIGETINANVPVISVMAEGQFKIEANITEIDIAKVRVGESAKVTLDAYGSEAIFEATVAEIDPAETIIEGVATYKVTLNFKEQDPRIKSGMTANIEILSDQRSNVIYLPERIIKTGPEGKFVKILREKNVEEARVETGMRASDGNVEIQSGVNEGDKIIISEI